MLSGKAVVIGLAVGGLIIVGYVLMSDKEKQVLPNKNTSGSVNRRSRITEAMLTDNRRRVPASQRQARTTQRQGSESL
jgi:hypothetical protein